MFSFFKRKPKNVNPAFSDLSLMLTQEKQNPVYKRELLDEKKLDFTLESIRHIDQYLSQIRNDELDEQEYMKVVLRCGAYIGETMRKINPDWNWFDHKQACKLFDWLQADEPMLSTTAILHNINEGHVAFPLAKVMKFIDNGEEDSTYFFAHTFINFDKLEKQTTSEDD